MLLLWASSNISLCEKVCVRKKAMGFQFLPWSCSSWPAIPVSEVSTVTLAGRLGFGGWRSKCGFTENLFGRLKRWLTVCRSFYLFLRFPLAWAWSGANISAALSKIYDKSLSDPKTLKLWPIGQRSGNGRIPSAVIRCPRNSNRAIKKKHLPLLIIKHLRVKSLKAFSRCFICSYSSLLAMMTSSM